MRNTLKTQGKFLFTALLAGVFLFGSLGIGFADEIVARGSDSTISVVETLTKAFKDKSGFVIKVEGGGSSNGAKACLAGEVPLAFMSRGPKYKEINAGLVVMAYAIDGVAIIVNPNNPDDNITMEQLKDIFTGQVTNWSDGKPIMAINRPSSSGTREVFHEKVLGKDADFGPRVVIKHDLAARATIAKVVTAIAFTSAGVLKDAEKLKVLTVNGIAPTPETLRNGTYPISRTLHFATKGAPSGKVKEFLDFVRSDEALQIIKQVGFVTLK
jgi:phosphate transport system substrate-binding protein